MISVLKIVVQVNVNQEDLQNFLAAAEELRIKGLSQASSEKLENAVPKMKQVSGGGSGLASQGQPPAKKPRESSPGAASAIDIDSAVTAINIVTTTLQISTTSLKLTKNSLHNTVSIVVTERLRDDAD